MKYNTAPIAHRLTSVDIGRRGSHVTMRLETTADAINAVLTPAEAALLARTLSEYAHD